MHSVSGCRLCGTVSPQMHMLLLGFKGSLWPAGDTAVQVGATLDVYESVQKQLLPTPNKSHYTFNLRDVSKVFQVSCNHEGITRGRLSCVLGKGALQYVRKVPAVLQHVSSNHHHWP